jgi:hypothetical protein
MQKAQAWRLQLRTDPVPALLDSTDKAIVYFTQRDLLGEETAPESSLWGLPEVNKLSRGQHDDGCWGKRGGDPNIYPSNHNQLVETFKRFCILVERYGTTRKHRPTAKAAEFLFSFQTPEGDIRGFIGNQYATYYTGYVLALLIQAGYGGDPRVTKGMQWLLGMRQNDGGWTIPILTQNYDRETWLRWTSRYTEPVEPDRSKPFSHNWTDMALRAFAAHPGYRKLPEAKAAGALLKSRFFMPDTYSSHRSPRYWTRFMFWWPNLLTVLESLLLLGFTKDDPDIKTGLDWFIKNQQQDGLWDLESGKAAKPKDRGEREWVGLRACRILKKYVD